MSIHSGRALSLIHNPLTHPRRFAAHFPPPSHPAAQAGFGRGAMPPLLLLAPIGACESYAGVLEIWGRAKMEWARLAIASHTGTFAFISTVRG
jgi:hypothetical protein